MATENYRELQRTTENYRELQRATESYREHAFQLTFFMLTHDFIVSVLMHLENKVHIIIIAAAAAITISILI